MSNAAEQEFEDETVAEALAKHDSNDDDSGFDIEIVDDTPEEDRGKPRRAEGAEPNIPEEDEIQSYSEGVQKRIKQLKFEYHEERRAKEEAARLQEEALSYAQQVQQQNKELLKRLEDNDGVLLSQAKGRVNAELDKAKAAYKAAYEIGDPDALIEAQERLTALQSEKIRYENYRPQKPQPVAQQPQPQQQPQIQKPSERALKWAERNQWFEKDPDMTGLAYGVHHRLQQAGVALDSEEYYNQIDAAVRRAFPDRFDDGEIEESASPRQTGNVVAPAARSSKKPRKIKLTSTQAALAKRLGLTPEQYAAQAMKEQNR